LNERGVNLSAWQLTRGQRNGHNGNRPPDEESSQDIAMRIRKLALYTITICLLIAGLTYLYRSAQTAANRANRANNMKQVGLAIRNFHDIHRRLPAAVRTDETGRPLASWRFQILPFIEAIMLDVAYDERWDAPVNRSVSLIPVVCYCNAQTGDPQQQLTTNIVAITGPGTAFDGDRPRRLEEIDDDTILAIEIVNSDIHWMEPGDLDVRELSHEHLRGPEGDGIYVLFADGSVAFVAAEAPLQSIKNFCTIAGAKKYDRENVLGIKTHFAPSLQP
jgi:hypothetical protein